MKTGKSTYTVEEAKKRMERYCAYQDRCHFEVEKKMGEMFLIPEARELILLHLMEHDFLNEERFARSFARGKFRIKKWGRIRIERELKQREISAYNIKKAMAEIDEQDYRETLKQLAEQKYASLTDESVWKKRRKLMDFLLYRGYESDRIREIIASLEKEK